MERKLNWGLYQVAVPLCLWFSLPAVGQDCRITGHVIDAGRAAVASAIVTVTQLDSGSSRQVLSNTQGYFQLAALPPGTYRIDAMKPGFKPLSRTGVELSPGSAFTLDLRMEDAEVSETVSLEARKSGAESLLVYICGLSLGSGCEMLEPLVIPTQAASPLLP